MASKAGVSVATISRALNEATRGKVAAPTLEKVERLIAKYRYTPNLAAKCLRESAYKTLGVVLPHHPGIFFNDYYVKLLAGVSDALLQKEYKFKMVLLKTEERRWDDYGFKYAEGIDGLIVTHWPKFFSDKSFFKRLDIPCVIVNDYEPDISAHFVCCDNEEGGRLAAEHLTSLGHQDFFVLTGHRWSSDSKLRLKGFQAQLKKKGLKLPKENIIEAGFQLQQAKEKVKEALQQKKKFTAIFCLNDGMAYGAIQAIQEMGFRCPEDISVVGFDNEKESATVVPPLTTVDQPVYALAQEAVAIILSHLQAGGRQKSIHKTLPVTLIPRNSVHGK